jgi:hypothetical protein
MSKKASKKKAAKPAQTNEQRNKAVADAFFRAVQPAIHLGVPEPMASQHTRSAFRRFQEYLEAATNE